MTICLDMSSEVAELAHRPGQGTETEGKEEKKQVTGDAVRVEPGPPSEEHHLKGQVGAPCLLNSPQFYSISNSTN